MKVKDLLSPEYQRKYDKACRDWKAGRNLREAAGIVYGTASKRRIAELVKHREFELALQGKRGKKLSVTGLGDFIFDGEVYVAKVRALLYSRGTLLVRIPPELEISDGIEQAWKKFRGREKTLLRELQTALCKYYRYIIQRPGSTAVENGRAQMNRNIDIWKSLGKPELTFLKQGPSIEILVGWTPDWEEEHGVYAYLDSKAVIRSVGEFDS